VKTEDGEEIPVESGEKPMEQWKVEKDPELPGMGGSEEGIENGDARKPKRPSEPPRELRWRSAEEVGGEGERLESKKLKDI
jgi:hypothetical protein